MTLFILSLADRLNPILRHWGSSAPSQTDRLAYLLLLFSLWEICVTHVDDTRRKNYSFLSRTHLSVQWASTFLRRNPNGLELVDNRANSECLQFFRPRVDWTRLKTARESWSPPKTDKMKNNKFIDFEPAWTINNQELIMAQLFWCFKGFCGLVPDGKSNRTQAYRNLEFSLNKFTIWHNSNGDTLNINGLIGIVNSDRTVLITCNIEVKTMKFFLIELHIFPLFSTLSMSLRYLFSLLPISENKTAEWSR